MTQIVNVPSCEDGIGHLAPNVDFMHVTDLNQQDKNRKRLEQRYKQRKINKTFKSTEKELDQDLLNQLQTLGLKVESIHVHHVSRTLSNGLRIVNFSQYFKGMTLLIIKAEGLAPLFTYSLCSLEDTYSRLEGRVYVKRKALNLLKSDKGFEALLTYPTDPQYVNSITPSKIGNWIAKTFLIPQKEKHIVSVNPLKYRNEELLLEQAKVVLSTAENIDPKSVKLFTQHLRFYKTALFERGLVCTPEWFNTLQAEGKELLSNGGYTVYGIRAKIKDTDETLVLVTFAKCSLEDSFVNSYGRKQCLMNFIKKDYSAFTLKQEVPSMNEALIKLAENALKHAINVEIVP